MFTIGILDFVFEEDKTDNEVFHHEVKMVDIRTGKVFFDKVTYIYLEMPKFNKTEEQLDTHFDKWLYVLKNLEKLTSRPKKLQEKIFLQLFDQAEIAHFNPQEYQQYEDSLKQYRDLKNVIDTAKNEAREEGKIEGKIEGKHETQIEVAISLRKAGVSIEIISQGTEGLSMTEIKAIFDSRSH